MIVPKNKFSFEKEMYLKMQFTGLWFSCSLIFLDYKVFKSFGLDRT
jgi:cell division protein FtsL